MGSYRRLLTLPAALARSRISGARVEAGLLHVTFETLFEYLKVGGEYCCVPLAVAWSYLCRPCCIELHGQIAAGIAAQVNDSLET